MSDANTRIAMELLRKVEAVPSQGNAFIIADELDRAEKRGKEEAAKIADALPLCELTSTNATSHKMTFGTGAKAQRNAIAAAIRES